MCGRFVVGSPLDLLVDRFEVDEVMTSELPPSWNVAPTESVYAVVDHDNRRLLGSFDWGLVAPGVADPRRSQRPINARAETLLERPAFKRAFAKRRCLIPTDGFYEWTVTDDGRKQAHFIHPADGGPMAFAGLWEIWRDPHRPDGQRMRTCAIVTTRANEVVAPLHDRMPVIVEQGDWEEWLDRSTFDAGALDRLLRPAPAGYLRVQVASSAVNSVRNKGPELITPSAH